MKPLHEGRRVRAVIVEDSKLTTDLLVGLLEEDPQLEVIGTASTGEEGIAKVMQLTPDLVTVDLGLPDIDGFEVIKQVMAKKATPILVLTATLDGRGPRDAYYALTLGALEVMKKPEASLIRDPRWRKRFCEQLKLLSRSPVIPHLLGNLEQRQATSSRDHVAVHPPGPRPTTTATSTPAPELQVDEGRGLIVIVGSAGSPRACSELLRGLRDRIPLPVPLLIAIHLDLEMGPQLAHYLSNVHGQPTHLLADGQVLRAGQIYVAPGGRHLELLRERRVRVFDTLPGSTCWPSLDYLLWSVARECGSQAVGVILSGMGTDGARGLLALRQAGGLTLGQNKRSCSIYGMPAAARSLDAVRHELPVADISRNLADWLTRRTRGEGAGA